MRLEKYKSAQCSKVGILANCFQKIKREYLIFLSVNDKCTRNKISFDIDEFIFFLNIMGCNFTIEWLLLPLRSQSENEESMFNQ